MKWIKEIVLKKISLISYWIICYFYKHLWKRYVFFIKIHSLLISFEKRKNISLTYKLLFHNFTFNQQKFQIFIPKEIIFTGNLWNFNIILCINLKFVTICWNFHTDTFKTLRKLYFSIVIFFFILSNDLPLISIFFLFNVLLFRIHSSKKCDLNANSNYLLWKQAN